MNLLLLGLLLGIDSLVVSLALGTLRPSVKRRRCLALSFALGDGLASWLGGISGAARWRACLEWGGWFGLAAVAGYGLLVLILSWRGRRLAEGRGSGLALLLPLCLSLDNLVVGVTDPTALLPAALVLAAVSGGLAYLGLTLGTAAAERARPQASWLAGSTLLAVAATLALKELLT